jgi:hypothetical protein
MVNYVAEHHPDHTARKSCIFICSPFAGDVKGNTIRAIRYMRFAIACGAIPFAPHLLYPQVLDETDPSERELGLYFGMTWLGKCDELWVFGREISSGMSREISKAKIRSIPIRYFNDQCEEEYR